MSVKLMQMELHAITNGIGRLHEGTYIKEPDALSEYLYLSLLDVTHE